MVRPPTTAPAKPYWFGRVPGRNKMVPETREGRLVTLGFVAGMLLSSLLGGLLMLLSIRWGLGFMAAGAAVMALGMNASGTAFILIAKRNCEPERA